jgi:predicted dehydrogenase
MLKEIEVDAVIVAVSIENTFNIVSYLLKKRIPLLVEKPVSINFKSALELSSLSKKNNVKNMVALNRRFYSNIIKVKKIIQEKKEKISNIVIEGHERFWKISGFYPAPIEKNWLFANSIHTLDLLTFFCGDINRLNILKKKRIKKNTENFQLSIEFKNSSLGSYISNWDVPGGWTMKIYTKNLCFNFSNLENCIYNDRNFIKNNIVLDKFDKKYKPGLYHMIDTFYDYLKYDRKNDGYQSISDNLKTMKLIHKIHEHKYQ